MTKEQTAELARLVKALEEVGGRGVELAERIDELRATREAAMQQFGDLGGAPSQPIKLQGGVVFLKPYGCRNCGHAFWTEDDDRRRLSPGPHPCPHCGVESLVPDAP